MCVDTNDMAELYASYVLALVYQQGLGLGLPQDCALMRMVVCNETKTGYLDSTAKQQEVSVVHLHEIGLYLSEQRCAQP